MFLEGPVLAEAAGGGVDMTASRTRSAFATCALTLLLSLASASPAPAQNNFVSPFIGFDFGGDSGCPEISGCEDKNVNWGVGVGSLGRVFGAEFEFAYIPSFFGEIPGVSSSVLTVMGNLMLAPKFGPVQPYGLVGLGLIKTRTELSLPAFLESSNNHFGWDVGGGLIIYPSQHFGIRGDVRYFHAFQDLEILGITLGDTKLDFGRASAGVVFKF
jgi:opacity protein-like surface antigen